MIRFNRDDVIAAARGRWREIIPALSRLEVDLNKKVEGPCPQPGCQGTTRFRPLNDFDETGALFCSHCFSDRNGDGLAALMWLNNIDFPTALEAVGEYLRVPRPASNRPSAQPAPKPKTDPPPKPVKPENELRKQFTPWGDSTTQAQQRIHDGLTKFAFAKPPITVAALHAAGAEMVIWPASQHHGMDCVAFPAYQSPSQVSGYILRRVDGQDFPEFGDSLKARKTHMIKGSVDGLVIPGGFERLARATTVLRVEGVPDAVAVYPLLPDDWAVLTNICGCKSIPPNMNSLLVGKTVISLGDSDTPGQEGASKFAAAVKASKAPKLQFPVIPDHGPDLRDFLAEGGTFEGLQQIIESTRAFVSQAFIVKDKQTREAEELQRFGFVVLENITTASQVADFDHVIFCQMEDVEPPAELLASIRKAKPGIKICTQQMAGFIDWLEERDAMEPREIEQAIAAFADAAPEIIPEPVLKIRTAGQLIAEFPNLRRSVIEGLLRIGEVMNIISAPKVGKSWLILGLALCVACGIKWLNRFWTTRGRVLLVDNELHCETLAHRIPKVADSLGLKESDYADNLHIISLRGQLRDLEILSQQLSDLQPGQYDLLILDAWYRLQPAGSDENSNGDVTKLYNLLDSVAHKIGCSFVCVHHSSKGSQTGKAVVDVGSGASAQARAPDSHLTMRAHQEDDAVVVQAEVRSWKPMEAFCMRRAFPAWTVAEDLDPKDLRSDKPSKTKKSDDGDPIETPEEKKARKEQDDIFSLLGVMADHPNGETSNILKAEAKVSGTEIVYYRSCLIKAGYATECTIKKNNRTETAYKISDLGKQVLSARGTVGKTIVFPFPTDRGAGGRITAPPLRSGIHPTDPARSEQSDLKFSDRSPDFDTTFGEQAI